MACILFSEPSIGGLKAKLLSEYSEVPEVKSSHLTEALASALGFRTHAAMLAEIRNRNRIIPTEDDYRLLDYGAFRRRLSELTDWPLDDTDDEFETSAYPGVIVTDQEPEIVYNTERAKAWRNIMVAAVNAGLAAGLFSIRPGDNRWPGATDRNRSTEAHLRFDLAPNLPALAWFSDAGFGELNVGVAIRPSAQALRLNRGALGFWAGDAIAESWLERERGAWVQSALTRFRCKRDLQPKLADLDIRPRCFGDRGRVIM